MEKLYCRAERTEEPAALAAEGRVCGELSEGQRRGFEPVQERGGQGQFGAGSRQYHSGWHAAEPSRGGIPLCKRADGEGGPAGYTQLRKKTRNGLSLKTWYVKI